MIAVVVTFDSARHVAACLRSLTGAPVIVVDNASQDGTVELVKSAFPNVDLVPLTRNSGLAAAINIGLARAGREDVLILNPDVEVGQGAVDALCSYLRRHPTVGVVAPLLFYPDGSPQESLRRFPTPLSMAARRTPFGKTRLGREAAARNVLSRRLESTPGAVDWALGAALLVRRRAIDEVGGMDEAFFLYNEDIDWCFRMWARGWEVHCCPDAVMTHGYARSSRSTFDLRNAATRHHWRSVIRLFARHPAMLLGFTRVGHLVDSPPSQPAPGHSTDGSACLGRRPVRQAER